MAVCWIFTHKCSCGDFSIIARLFLAMSQAVSTPTCLPISRMPLGPTEFTFGRILLILRRTSFLDGGTLQNPANQVCRENCPVTLLCISIEALVPLWTEWLLHHKLCIESLCWAFAVYQVVLTGFLYGSIRSHPELLVLQPWTHYARYEVSWGKKHHPDQWNSLSTLFLQEWNGRVSLWFSSSPFNSCSFCSSFC